MWILRKAFVTTG